MVVRDWVQSNLQGAIVYILLTCCFLFFFLPFTHFSFVEPFAVFSDFYIYLLLLLSLVDAGAHFKNLISCRLEPCVGGVLVYRKCIKSLSSAAFHLTSYYGCFCFYCSWMQYLKLII